MRFENLLEAVPDALVGMDQKGMIRFVNRQTESLFGYDRDQLIGQRIDMLAPETLWQIYAQHQKDYFADPRTRSSGLDVELSGRHHNGGEFPIHASMTSIDTGDVLLVITGVGDVATQQRAVTNAGLVEAIVEHSDDAIVGLTIDGTVTTWNPAAARMYGYSPMEVIGRSDRLISPERAGELEAVLARIRDGHVEHAETTLVRKDGTVVPVSITAAPIRDEGGTVVGVSAVHRDVTEQRQAFESAQRLAAIVENSDDGVFGASLDGIITSWNPGAEGMFGYSSAEIVGSPPRS
jgi:PAS domain S-box-containing protein